jgi:AcrR family transcriptional regulator
MRRQTRAIVTDMTNEVQAADGRVIGERALATRRRLLDATVATLERDGVLDLKVVDITREIGMAAATFYQYFADVDAAILALAEEAIEDERPLVDHLEPAWSTPADVERARAFIDAYATYFDDHQAVLRVLFLKAEEGEPSYRAVRSSANLLILRRMAAMLKEGQADGRIPMSLDPFATSAAMLAMIERLLTYQNEIRRRGTSKKAMRETLTTIVFRTLSGIST